MWLHVCETCMYTGLFNNYCKHIHSEFAGTALKAHEVKIIILYLSLGRHQYISALFGKNTCRSVYFNKSEFNWINKQFIVTNFLRKKVIKITPKYEIYVSYKPSWIQLFILYLISLKIIEISYSITVWKNRKRSRSTF